MGNKFEQYRAQKAEQERINLEQLKMFEKQLDKRFKLVYEKLIENCVVDQQNHLDLHYEHIDLLHSKYNENFLLARKEIKFDKELEAIKSQIEFQNRALELLHPNLIQLHTSAYIRNESLFSTQYKNYLLFDNIQKTLEEEMLEVSKFDEDDLWFFLDSMVGALSFLQKQNIHHQSLKFSHIYLVLTPNNVRLFKISDVFLMKYDSLLVHAQKNHTHELQMKNIYLSPEELIYLRNEDFQQRARCWHICRHEEPVPPVIINPYKSDVFTLGMILSHLALWKNLNQYYNYNSYSLQPTFSNDIQTEILSKCSSELYNIIKLMLQIDQEERPDLLKLDQLLDDTDHFQKNKRLKNLFQKEYLSPVLQLPKVELDVQLRDEYMNFMQNQAQKQQQQQQIVQQQFQLQPLQPQQQQTQQDNIIAAYLFGNKNNNNNIHTQIQDKFQGNKIEQTKILDQSQLNNQQYNSFVGQQQLQTNNIDLLQTMLQKQKQNDQQIQMLKTQQKQQQQKNHQNNFEVSYNMPYQNNIMNSQNLMMTNPLQFQQFQAMNMIMMQQQNPQMFMMMQNSQNMQPLKNQLNQYNSNQSAQNGFQTPIRQPPGPENFKDTGLDVKIETIDYKNGSKYTGQVLNGLRHGYGKFVFLDGGYYEGQYQNNQMHGQGKLYYNQNQLAYDGEWFQDKFNSFGVYFNKIVKKNFQGSIDYKDFSHIGDVWTKYQGDFVMDQKDGQGILEFCTGEKFSGNFQKDKINGYGIFTKINGQAVIGVWENNNFVQDLVN